MAASGACRAPPKGSPRTNGSVRSEKTEQAKYLNTPWSRTHAFGFKRFSEPQV